MEILIEAPWGGSVGVGISWTEGGIGGLMKPKPLESPIPGETFSSPERRKIFCSAVFFTDPPPQCFSHQPSAELHYIRGSQKCAVGPFFIQAGGNKCRPAYLFPLSRHTALLNFIEIHDAQQFQTNIQKRIRETKVKNNPAR